MDKYREIGKYISILQRISSIYFSNQLSFYQIGCGQQFFLLQIYKNPGKNLQELAAYGYYDKATATRAVKKLEEEGYVRTIMDGEDKRVRRIYATESAKAVVEKTRESMDSWVEIILGGLTVEERETVQVLLIRMAGNAHSYLKDEKRKE